MFEGIVNIESKSNSSFGTGFVIDKDAKGVYILTCKHVLEDLHSPVIEDQEVTIVAQGDFIDLAVIYVHGFSFKAFSLSSDPCESKNVKVIGFSSFNKSVNQKTQIQATLDEKQIELHSTKDDSSYLVRKIKAKEDYSFDRGNSGSPVLCEETGKVIAVLSNKKGSQLGYTIDITYLKEIWTEMPSKLLKKSKLKDLKEKIRPQSILNRVTQQDRIKRYLIPLVATVSFLAGGYFWMTPTSSAYLKDYRVINIRNNDTLNVRAGKSEKHWKIGELPYNAHNINLIECAINKKDEKWCRIQYGNTKGWVSAKYITEENINIIEKSNSKPINEENQNLRLQVTYPPSVKRGENIILTATLINEGQAEASGGITLSFPQRPLLNYSVLFNDFKLLKLYKISNSIYNNHKKQADKMDAIHPIIESNDIDWKKSEKHQFSLSIKTPKELKQLKIRVRASLELNRVVPLDGMVDQQGFASREITVNIID